MNICLNGYSDYVSSVSDFDEASVSIAPEEKPQLEFEPSGFFLPSREKYDYRKPYCTFFAQVHFIVRLGTALMLIDLLEIAGGRRNAHQLAAHAILLTSLEFVRWEAIKAMDDICKYPPGRVPKPKEIELIEPEPIFVPVQAYRKIEVEDIGWFAKIAAALVAAGAKALEVRKEADESAAAFAGAVGGALFIMPLNPSLLDFHHDENGPL